MMIVQGCSTPKDRSDSDGLVNGWRFDDFEIGMSDVAAQLHLTGAQQDCLTEQIWRLAQALKLDIQDGGEALRTVGGRRTRELRDIAERCLGLVWLFSGYSARPLSTSAALKCTESLPQSDDSIANAWNRLLFGDYSPEPSLREAMSVSDACPTPTSAPTIVP